ncbi:uncharacterized protein FOMMEDRAFT_16982 [Fomitiporia mediterranea MF3/22]|uniref:uncharacterized protein n=1 Tax=Fomitiporia mediterranea (strain MF3/22) TaxID=694068 RepID=UPI00044096CF|nr:uncharacterized protein FOMMEDRAFT_16982 [Fomitiporia mediterranea MF3/22]EJD06416.1 hypothetical protein FOMMEDRAFT_16982 [Fomitiporia mediterranea MF3/22]
MITSALLALAVANVVRAQSTASLFPVGFQGDDLQGTVVGTGAQGTTYVLSATFGDLGIPYTLTLVQGSTYLSEGADIVTAGITVPIDAECGIQGSNAVCTEVVGSGIDGTTITESGPIFLTAVPVNGAVNSGATTRSSSPSVTFTGSQLPPELTQTSDLLGSLGPTATGSSSGNGGGIGVPGASGSGAMQISIISVSLLLPVLSVIFNSL